MANVDSGRLFIIAVLLIGAVSAVLYYTGVAVPTVGATITSVSSLAQCDDTQTLLSGDIASQDSIFVSSSVRRRTRTSVTSPWSAWTTAGADSCAGLTKLNERSCVAGTAALASVSATCANNCTSGRCNLPVCSDPDAGAAEFTTGATTTGLMISSPSPLSALSGVGVSPATQAEQRYPDYCSSSATLIEHRCTNLGSARNRYVSRASKPCSAVGSGYTCIDPDGVSGSTPARCGVVCTPSTEVCGNSIDEDCSGADLACPPSGDETICDGRDDNGNGVIDEGCDDDNDNHCDASMTQTPAHYSCVDYTNPNCCGMGTYPSYSSVDCDDTNATVHPSRLDICGNGVDEDCSGADRVCSVCTDSDGGANPVTEGGLVTVTNIEPGSWLAGPFLDGCNGVVAINETACLSTAGNVYTSAYGPFVGGRLSASCPEGMGCFDADGWNPNAYPRPADTSPAYCATPASCSDSDASAADPRRVGGSVTITSAAGHTMMYLDTCTGYGIAAELSCEGTTPSVTTAPCAVGTCRSSASGAYCG